MRNILTIVSALALTSLPATAAISYTFSDGTIPTGCSNSSGTAQIINGNLHVEMGMSSNKYRSDIQFNNQANIKLNPSTDRYLAIKFNGAAPNGKMTVEFNDGTKWYNKMWNGNANRSVYSDGNSNTVYYFDLSKDTDYAALSDEANIATLNIKVADNSNIPCYSVDWIKSFSTEDELKAAASMQDDGDNDFAIVNETTSKGYHNLLTAISEATASGQNCTLVVCQNCQLMDSRATIGATELTIKGSDPIITITRNKTTNMFFLINGTSSAKLTIKDLTLDGQNQIGNRMVESNSAGGGAIMDNVTFRNINGTQTGAAVFVAKTFTIKDCKFSNIKDDTNGIDKGVIFMAANGLTLQGNNTFENCGVNIYNDGNFDFTNGNTNHITPINITIDTSKKALNGKVVGSCHEPWKYMINNDGYCLLYNGKDNHLYLAEGYSLTVSDLHFATFYGDANKSLMIPLGLEAYYCIVASDRSYVNLYQISDVIPADTPLLFYSSETTPKLYQLVSTEEQVSSIPNNDLKGSATSIELNGADASYYFLAKEDGNAVFKQIDPSKTATSAAHKAYLMIDKDSSNIPAMRIVKSEGIESEESGIENVISAPECDGVTYNIYGQTVGSSYRGIIVRNGKKFLQR